MLQLSVDSSTTTGRKSKSFHVQLTVVGLSWLKPETSPLPPSTAFHLWEWDRPEHLLVFFRNGQGDVINLQSPLKLPVISTTPRAYEADVTSLKTEYKEIIDKRISGANGVVWKEVYWNLDGGGNQEINLTDEQEIADSNDFVAGGGKGTGYLFAAVGQLAQKLPPLNQYLNLVFFASAENVVIPDDATEFFCFPASNISGSRWSGMLPGFSTLSRKYNVQGFEEMAVYTDFTPIPLSNANPPPLINAATSPIHLRDNEGNFAGHVDIRVRDVEDWMPGFMPRVSDHFDYAVMFVKFLQANEKRLAWNAAEESFEIYRSRIMGYDKFLCAVMRDALGCGLLKTPDGVDLIEHVVRKKLADSENGPSDGGDNSEYFRKYKDLYDKIRTTLDTFNQNISHESWRKLLRDVFEPRDTNKTSLNLILTLDPDAVRDNKEQIRKWMEAWEVFMETFGEKQKELPGNADAREIQKEIVSAQWREAGLKEEVEDLKSVLKDLQDIRLFQKHGIAAIYVQDIFNVKYDPDTEIQQVIDNTVNSICKYFSDRKENMIPERVFFPEVTDPFTAAHATFNWNNFMSECRKELIAIIDENKPSFFPGDYAEENAQTGVTYDIPSPVRVTVAAIGSAPQDDLADEIAGHVLLMRRGKKAIETAPFEDWRCLNKIKIKDGGLSYVVPSALPETSDVKRAAFEIRNEKISLVAGHKTFNDPKKTDSQVRNDLKYLFDPDHRGYGLWYGYDYQFAGFVALNSGVLPPALRAERDGALNIPADKFIFEPPHPANLRYLRRVPVAPVRVQAVGENGSPLSPPKGFLPLAKELNEWDFKNKTTSNYQHALYLLGDDPKFPQPVITLHLRKPTTSYWNWYSWLGAEVDEPIKMKALATDLRIRTNNAEAALAGKLCDPAVDDSLYVVAERVFPESNDKQKDWFTVDKTKLLEDGEVSVFFGLKGSSNDLNFSFEPGEVWKVNIHARVNRKHFTGDTPKFHNWMEEKISSPDLEAQHIENETFVLTKPVEIFFETAIDPTQGVEWLKKLEKELWEKMLISPHATAKDKIELYLERDKSLVHLSRATVRHQVWNWNGRLDESEPLLFSSLNPVKNSENRFTTSDAMKWEAWAFSDRPDFASIESETNLIADPEEERKQLLFTDHRPGEDKALYYRFSITAYSRYELLGDKYMASFDSVIEVDKVDNQWKRFLRKCNRTQPLPKPSLRFAMPLTKSITDKNNGQVAPILLVLNDRWFTEAGLAEKLEAAVQLATEKVKDQQGNITATNYYLNAGPDPILEGNGLSSVKPELLSVDDPNTRTFPVKGPIGLTFDFAAQTPKLKGCAFILEAPDLRELTGREGEVLNPWAFMQISLRRSLREQACENGEAMKKLSSEWTAPEWVQFLPSVQSFIPTMWHTEVNQKQFLRLAFQTSGSTKTLRVVNGVLPVYDSKFEDLFVVLTEMVSDISGEPCEKYVATYRVTNSVLELNDSDSKQFEVHEGFLRLLLVRKRFKSEPAEADTSASIWKRLFGQRADRQNKSSVDDDVIENDPTAALPLISDRVPFKLQ